MKLIESTLRILVISALTFAAATTSVIAQNSVQGTLTVDTDTTAIKHIYFDQYGEEFLIILANNSIAPEMIPDGVNGLSEQGKVRALEFTVSRKTKQILSSLRKAIYFHPIWTRNISIGNGELTISKFDENILEGTIKTPSENESGGHKFSYDISFSVSLKKEPLKFTVTGKNDAPSKAYAAYGKAIMAGDAEGFKKYFPSEKTTMLPKDPKELVLGLQFIQGTMMTDVEVLSSTITGNKAVLILSGKRGIATADGKVDMLLENSGWKISEESWKLSEGEKAK